MILVRRQGATNRQQSVLKPSVPSTKGGGWGLLWQAVAKGLDGFGFAKNLGKKTFQAR